MVCAAISGAPGGSSGTRPHCSMRANRPARVFSLGRVTPARGRCRSPPIGPARVSAPKRRAICARRIPMRSCRASTRTVAGSRSRAEAMAHKRKVPAACVVKGAIRSRGDAGELEVPSSSQSASASSQSSQRCAPLPSALISIARQSPWVSVAGDGHASGEELGSLAARISMQFEKSSALAFCELAEKGRVVA